MAQKDPIFRTLDGIEQDEFLLLKDAFDSLKSAVDTCNRLRDPRQKQIKQKEVSRKSDFFFDKVMEWVRRPTIENNKDCLSLEITDVRRERLRVLHAFVADGLRNEDLRDSDQYKKDLKDLAQEVAGYLRKRSLDAIQPSEVEEFKEEEVDQDETEPKYINPPLHEEDDMYDPRKQFASYEFDEYPQYLPEDAPQADEDNGDQLSIHSDDLTADKDVYNRFVDDLRDIFSQYDQDNGIEGATQETTDAGDLHHREMSDDDMKDATMVGIMGEGDNGTSVAAVGTDGEDKVTGLTAVDMESDKIRVKVEHETT